LMSPEIRMVLDISKTPSRQTDSRSPAKC
jgi:hypothetical protein